MHQKSVTYVAAKDAPLLLSASGEAVIPIGSQQMLTRVARVAALHGLTLVPAENCCAARGPTVVAHGLVAASGEALMGVARLYGYLSGRATVRITPGQPLPRDCEMVLLASSDWTSAAADWIEEEASTRPGGLGILIAPDVDVMHEVAVCRAVALAGAPAEQPRRLTMLAADAPLSERIGTNVRLIGAQTDATAVRRALSAANDLLLVHAHADGFDARLGDKAILCAYRGRSAATNGGQDAACLVRGRCHRLGDIDLATAWQGQQLIAPRALCGRIVALELCSGMPVAGRCSNPAASLGAAILAEACFGAMISSVEVHVSTPPARAALIAALRDEPRIGVALHRINSDAQAQALGRALFLFGDPRYGGADRMPIAGHDLA